MVKSLTLEERKRRSRNILFSAFILLIVIWTVKLAFPQQTLISAYQNHKAGQSSLQPVATASSTGAASAPTGTPVNGEEKPKAVADMFSESIKPFNGSVTTKAAVIIETRFRTNLVPLILHFGSVLGPTWPILIYTSAEAVGQFSTSAALARYLRTGIIQVRILPQTTLFTNSDSVNAFMTQKWIWEDLAPAEHILIFQSDSMLCANAARSVEDYFHYDLVGAPIAKDLGKGYNGGLSLRKRSTILRILDTWDWEKTKKDGDRFEDQWFYNRFAPLSSYQRSVY
jgi:hypothetical protein